MSGSNPFFYRPSQGEAYNYSYHNDNNGADVPPNVSIPVANQPSQQPPPSFRRTLSTDANRNLSILLASQNATYHWLYGVWNIIYNLPQIVAIVWVLSKHWNDKWSYLYRQSSLHPWTRITVRGTGACTSPIHAWVVVYGCIRAFMLYYHCYKYYKIRRGMSQMDFEFTRIARYHRFMGVLSSVTFILGMIWTLNEQTCQSMSYKVYQLCFILMIINWISVLAPCIILVVLAPFIYFCAPCVIRLLRIFIEPGENGMGATEDIIDSIRVGKYSPPADRSDASDHGTVEGVGRVSNDSCPICLVDFEAGETLKVLPCSGSHTYHSECVAEWLRVNSICCLCREPVNNTTLRREEERRANEAANQASAPSHSDAAIAAV